jgi:hypothetical protein
MKISISGYYGGPELAESAVSTSIRKIGLLIQSKCPSYLDETGAGINIVFCVAGSLLSHPDWEGVQIGKFSKKRKLLQIDAAVPEKMVSSDNIGPFLCELMRQGVIEAKPIYEKAKIPFDADAFTKFIDDIERELGWRK